MSDDEEHVDFVSLRDIARLTAMDARQAKAIEAQRAETNGDSVPSSDESAVGNADLPK